MLKKLKRKTGTQQPSNDDNKEKCGNKRFLHITVYLGLIIVVITCCLQEFTTTTSFGIGGFFTKTTTNSSTTTTTSIFSDYLRGVRLTTTRSGQKKVLLNNNNNNETTSTKKSSSSNKQPLPLLQQIAPSIFPMDPNTNNAANGGTPKIRFPPSVQHVVIDVGAFESDYMATLEQHPDPTIALIMVDPLPESVFPLVARAATYNMKGMSRGVHYGDPRNSDYADHVFVIRGAMGLEETVTNFQVSSQPYCGSLLKVDDGNKFGCWDTVNQLPVNVFTLESLLDMIPTNTTTSSNIQTIHLKTDCEGADHLALKGGGSKGALRRLTTIIIECWNPNRDNNKLRREGMCRDDEVTEWMCKQQQFCGQKIRYQYDLSNIVFWNQKRLTSVSQIPNFLTWPTIQFHALYQELKGKLLS